MFENTAFDYANEVFYQDPNMGPVIARYAPSQGAGYDVTLLDIAIDETTFFGDTTIRSDAINKQVSRREIPERPKQGETFTWDGQAWAVMSAERDHEMVNWRLNLRPVQREGA